ncbi:hypothetical protein [Acetobacter conturbans]|uniref:Uncharacterized protein n=1 Tax=Acetobacter conturbans TaxID=1737472 RepID=A0ABX0K175_9PROT|nr:hypothetical protein [Acetobacter conturbans]NHN88864.1 hypothetical protein [Acetobacter conturbans]
MASIADIEEKIATEISRYIYPDNLTVYGESSINQNVKICRGWPQETELGKDMMSSPGTSWVAINQKSGSAKNTTRYNRRWQTLEDDTNFGLQVTDASEASNAVTFLGTAYTSGVAGVIIDGTAYPVPVQIGYTAELITQNICKLINSVSLLSPDCSGSKISLDNDSKIIGRCAKNIQLYRELSRSSIAICVSIFSPSIIQRDKIENAVMDALLSSDELSTPSFDHGAISFLNREINDTNLNANTYRVDLIWNIEFSIIETMLTPPVLWPGGEVNSLMQIGLKGAKTLTPPMIGALRFDAWYGMTTDVEKQCAAALSNAQWSDRLPLTAQITDSTSLSWSVITQDVMDAEINYAIDSGISFWVFNRFSIDNWLTDAINFYINSQVENKIKFCLSTPYSIIESLSTNDKIIETDLTLLENDNYIKTSLGEYLYFIVLNSTQISLNIINKYITNLRNACKKSNLPNLYITILIDSINYEYFFDVANSGIDFDSISFQKISSIPSGDTSYTKLTHACEIAWKKASQTGFPIIPTAMAGWDRRPLIDNPQPLFPLIGGETTGGFYEQPQSEELVSHIKMLENFIIDNDSCPSNIGLIFSWNNFVEGSWISPTYSQNKPEIDRINAVNSILSSISDFEIFN